MSLVHHLDNGRNRRRALEYHDAEQRRDEPRRDVTLTALVILVTIATTARLLLWGGPAL